jgi:hypothetical protein
MGHLRTVMRRHLDPAHHGDRKPGTAIASQQVTAGAGAKPDHERRKRRRNVVVALRAPPPQPSRFVTVKVSQRGDWWRR